jgi:DnaJ family protein A protein 5
MKKAPPPKETLNEDAARKSAGAAYRGKCYYEVLGVERTATEAEIKQAYHKMAIQWHPDKNSDRLAEATEIFKYVQNAHSVLNDTVERAWYDKNREAILREARGEGSAGGSQETGASWMKFFSSMCYSGFDESPSGFFTVYGGLFMVINNLEKQGNSLGADATAGGSAGGSSRKGTKGPMFGESDSPWESTQEFYDWWGGFATARSFSFVDEYDLEAAPNRPLRRAMEKENLQARKDAKKEYNDVVTGLVEFVKRRDPRVSAHKLQVETDKIEKEIKKAEEKELAEVAFLEKKEQWRLAQLKEEEKEKARLEKLSEEGGEGGDDGEEEAMLSIADIDDDEWYGKGKGKKVKKKKGDEKNETEERAQAKKEAAKAKKEAEKAKKEEAKEKARLKREKKKLQKQRQKMKQKGNTEKGAGDADGPATAEIGAEKAKENATEEGAELANSDSDDANSDSDDGSGGDGGGSGRTRDGGSGGDASSGSDAEDFDALLAMANMKSKQPKPGSYIRIHAYTRALAHPPSNAAASMFRLPQHPRFLFFSIDFLY